MHARYMVAESSDALYVAFMGTKQMRDVWTNASVGMASLRADQADYDHDEVSRMLQKTARIFKHNVFIIIYTFLHTRSGIVSTEHSSGSHRTRKAD